MKRRSRWAWVSYGAVAMIVAGGMVAVSGAVPMQANQQPGLLDLLGDAMFESALFWRAPKEKNALADDPEAARIGLHHYGEMCAGCHGAPGLKPMRAAETMLPRPPNLAETAGESSDGEIFYVIEQGVRMTGMPAFGPVVPSQRRIWSLVAAVRTLGSLTPEEQKLLRGSE